MSSIIDTLVIGSGFGGAVVAHKLVMAGQRVTLIERGPWRDTAALRPVLLPEKAPLPHGQHFFTHLLRQVSMGYMGKRWNIQQDGLFDLHIDRGMTSLSSSGVGGGSHVYLAMNMRPERKDYWDNVASGLDAASMETHYAWMLARMGSRQSNADDHAPNRVQDRFSENSVIDCSVAQPELGFRFGGQYGNNALLGDASGCKVTLDQLLLAPLLDRGLTVLSRHEALAVHREGERYRVEIQQADGRRRFLRAQRVVLAAGTLNTLRLLRHSQLQGGLGSLPALGKGYSGNGDVFALWRAGEQGEDFRAGAPCLGRFTLRDLPDSPMLYALGLNGLDNIPVVPKLLRRRMANWMFLVGMGQDRANGEIRWHDDMPEICYSAENNPILGQIHRAMALLGKKTGQPLAAWRPSTTVHSLGGARVGDDPQNSVVNGFGQVHGHAGLYITDGSALPAATGTPPSMSIAAWAAHVSQTLTQESVS